MTPTLSVEPISPSRHEGFLRHENPSASFLQWPSWARAKPGWAPLSVGWFDRSRTGTATLRGAGFILHRRLPGIGRTLAYLPEGPVLPWETFGSDGADWLRPLGQFCAERGAFAVRVGPPVVTRTWSSATVKAALADDSVRVITEVKPDDIPLSGADVIEALQKNGWRLAHDGTGFAAGQPAHVMQIPLTGRTSTEILASMSQLWRRNIRTADKKGVTVRVGDQPTDVQTFHELYVQSAVRDGFTPRPLRYFEQLFTLFSQSDGVQWRVYLAELDGVALSAALFAIAGEHAWYCYGGSSAEGHQARSSNALQWRMLQDALAAGCRRYDLRGVGSGVSDDDPLVGLTRFKTSMGADLHEYVGEWDLPLNRLLYKAFRLYLGRRS
ncbi:MAG: lipid II:glycine glycyltransferase FemX [Actinomycetota bacterium]